MWERYRVYIVGAVTALLAQAVLIAGLFIQRTRLRKAEQQVRSSQAALHKSYDRIRDLGSRLLKAQEDERSRIARELHDDISQQLTVLTIDLKLLGQQVQGHTETAAAEALKRVEDIGTSVHDLSHRLHPARLRVIGLVDALNGLKRELSHPEVTVTFTHEGVPPTLPPISRLSVPGRARGAAKCLQTQSSAERVSGSDGRVRRHRPDYRGRWRGVRRRRRMAQRARAD